MSEPIQDYEHLGEQVNKHKIYDMDFHLHVPTDKLVPYIENDKIRNKVKRFGPPGKAGSGIKRAYATENIRENSHERPQGEAIDREEILEVSKSLGTDVTIATPGTHFRFAGIKYPVIKTELARAYNNYILDKVIDVENDIYAAFVLPKWDIEASLEELDRLGDRDGIVAAQNWYGHPQKWGEYELDPIYDKMTSLNLPLLLHSGGGGGGLTHLTDSQSTRLEWSFSKKAYNVIADVLNMISHGLFDKYPDLEVVMQEGGTMWIPFIAQRADELYNVYHGDIELTERAFNQGQEYLQHNPSYYLFNNMYVTTQPIALPSKSSQIGPMMDLCRAKDMFMFSTDWPHLTVDTANWVFEHSAISEDLKKDILHKNAEKVLRLPDT